MKNQLKTLTGIVALALAGQAYALTDWILASDYGTVSSNVSVFAYSNTGGTGETNNAAGQTIKAASWAATYGGINNADGCGSGTTCDAGDLAYPNGTIEHSIDNNQRYDMALLSFTSVVKLTQMKLGWAPYDSDVTVMAYTGSGNPNDIGEQWSITGKTYSQLVAAGWAFVGNYANIGTVKTDINSSGILSSYWLIGAYNPLVAGSANGAETKVCDALGVCTGSFDYVKLASVHGCIQGSTGCNPPGQVPEPGSLALMGIGLLGLMRMRKAVKA